MVKASEDTRDKIIAAAYEVLAEQGYDKASTKAIAQHAGVAQGLINYYFTSKDDLYAEVFRKENERFGEFFEKLYELPIDERFIDRAMEFTRLKTESQLGNNKRLRYELFAIGLRNETVKHDIMACFDEGRRCIRRLLDKMDLKADIGSDAVASVLLSALDGLALQKMVDPRFDLKSAFDVLGTMLKAYLASQTTS
jgi:AcrR family transcriptional regulator